MSFKCKMKKDWFLGKLYVFLYFSIPFHCFATYRDIKERNIMTREAILHFLSQNKSLFYQRYSVEKIGLFGSYARNQQSDSSDIDIIIDMSKNAEDIFDKRMALKEFLSKHFSISVDVCHERALKPIFKDSVLKEVIYV